MNHNHDNAPAPPNPPAGGAGGAPCPHCVAAKNKIPHQSPEVQQVDYGAGKLGAGLRFAPQDDRSFGEKLRAFLGVCGCFSCYVAMFPAILLGIVGILGLSSTQTLDALNAYMGSVLFQPILIISILLLIIGLLRYGGTSLVLSILAGIGIFASMNFYMRAWLFTLSFGMLALAYYLAFRKTKAQQLKVVLVFLLAVVVLGVIDLGRSRLPSPSEPPSTNGMDMMQ